MKSVLYLPSTPLNVLLTLAHAAENRDSQQSHVVLIDQKNTADNIYFSILRQSGLFQSVAILAGTAKGKDKLKERNVNFAKLTGWMDQWQPELVMVGSDRRVEFQFVMNLLKNTKARGAYLDDGLYSYAGKPFAWYKDSVNSLLKKLSYGFWWDEPKTVGASKWVQEVWLFQPDKAVQALQHKQRYKIEPQWFRSQVMAAITDKALRAFSLSDKEIQQLADIDVFITFPHPNDIEKMAGYQQRVEMFLQLAQSMELKVAVKYHPRMPEKDSWCLVERFNVWLAPTTLAFEFMLPLLKPNSIVLGDVGTIVMTAKWLRPDLRSFAVLNADDSYAASFIPVMQNLEIPLINDFEDALKNE